MISDERALELIESLMAHEGTEEEEDAWMDELCSRFPNAVKAFRYRGAKPTAHEVLEKMKDLDKPILL